jgi:hypothetical protein
MGTMWLLRAFRRGRAVSMGGLNWCQHHYHAPVSRCWDCGSPQSDFHFLFISTLNVLKEWLEERVGEVT